MGGLVGVSDSHPLRGQHQPFGTLLLQLCVGVKPNVFLAQEVTRLQREFRPVRMTTPLKVSVRRAKSRKHQCKNLTFVFHHRSLLINWRP